MEAEVDLTGRRLGRFEIRSLLGRGGMGAVYRAWDSNLDRHVAIKILPPHLVADPERVRRFVQEAKSASALNHPHVIAIYDIGQEDSTHYIAMELVEGATLRERMAGTAMELKRAIAIGEEIAGAIGAAHEAGVVHRDLKPENILVANAGYVKVLDFGLAKLRREESIPGDASTQFKSTEPGKILGTVGYMSPEQAEGKPVDHRSDIFSLGCILYEMVAGRSPFRGRTHVDTLHNIVHAEPPPLQTIHPDVPPEMQRIIAKSLAKAPEERYQSAKDLAVDLKRLRRELDSSASVTSEYVRPAQRRRWIPAAIAAIAIAGVAAIAIVLWPRRRAEPPKPSLAIQRLTSTGLVIGAAVSPDGKYIAYASSEQGLQGLWLRQLATKQDLQLLPPAQVGVWGYAFSRDGSSIYYALKSEANPRGTLYSVASLGGPSRRILDGIDSAVTFSPDGKQLAFARVLSERGQSAIVIVNADGSGARTLAKREPPEYFVPIFYTAPSWSPDGKRIAASVRTAAAVAKIIAVDVATGAEEVVSAGWHSAQAVAWLPAGDALVAVGSRGDGNEQLWLVPYPSGEPLRITNDLLSYRMPSVTADGSAIVAVGQDMDAELWHVPLAGSGPPRKIMDGKALGIHGVSVARDGTIAYTAIENAGTDIWIMDANGQSQQRLSTGPAHHSDPSFLPDGRSLVFTTVSPAGASVRRIELDGVRRQSDIAGIAYDPPALAPDGRTVVFRWSGGLARVPVSGGRPVAIASYHALRPAVSPDGTKIACYCQTDPAQPLRLCIVPMSGGPPSKMIVTAGPHFTSMFQWTLDGRALLLNTMPGDRRNVWMLPLDGGEPKRLTSFDEQTLFRFAQTPDGKALVVSRGELSRDAVMITGFR